MSVPQNNKARLNSPSGNHRPHSETNVVVYVITAGGILLNIDAYRPVPIFQMRCNCFYQRISRKIDRIQYMLIFYGFHSYELSLLCT